MRWKLLDGLSRDDLIVGGRYWKISGKVILVYQMKYDEVLDQGEGIEGGQKCLDLGDIQRLYISRFILMIGYGYEVIRGLKYDLGLGFE